MVGQSIGFTKTIGVGCYESPLLLCYRKSEAVFKVVNGYWLQCNYMNQLLAKTCWIRELSSLSVLVLPAKISVVGFMLVPNTINHFPLTGASSSIDKGEEAPVCYTYKPLLRNIGVWSCIKLAIRPTPDLTVMLKAT